MSEQLQGMELDLAVAQAMRHFDRFGESIPTQIEKLDWLRERCGEIGIWINHLGFYAQAAIKCPEHVMLGEVPGDFEASGDTFDEMLSRLVLEVAKR